MKRGDHSSVFLLYALGVALVVLAGLSANYLLDYVGSEDSSEDLDIDVRIISFCGDGTPHGICSNRTSFFCSQGVLYENSILCGCPFNTTEDGSSCTSEFKEEPKELSLRYVLRGKEGFVNYTVYNGLSEHLSDLPRFFKTQEGEEGPSLTDFKYRNLIDLNQSALLLPLVSEIQNLDHDKEDQARIAISLVQNIPYGFSDDNITSQYGTAVDLLQTRYPYESLYDVEGVCGEKSELLAFLLSEIGYDVVLFRYLQENHEVVGVKCPVEHSSYGSGYCFIESTRPAIITDNTNEYEGIGKLVSTPQVLDISDLSQHSYAFGGDMYEFEDVQEWYSLNEDVLNYGGRISNRKYESWKSLVEKYGLVVPDHVVSFIEESREF